MRPTRDIDGPSIPAWPCSWWGLQATPVTRSAGGLLHHLFTLACVQRPSAVCFLLHFPSGHPAWVLPSTMPCGVRTFLDLGDPHAAAVRRTRNSILVASSYVSAGDRRPPTTPPNPPNRIETSARTRTLNIDADVDERLANRIKMPPKRSPEIAP